MKIKNLNLLNKTFLAPLANFNTHAFQILCLRYQAALVFTEMYNIYAIINNFTKFQKELELFPEEHPISLQLIGNDPRALAKAMDLVSSLEYDGFDLNLGCPAPDELKCELGGFLLKKPERIRPLISTMVNATNKAVSAKIRIGYNNSQINAVEVSKIIEEEGADFITIHGRTVKAGFSSENNLDIIRECKSKVNIPIVGNGNVVDGPSAEKMLDYTKCDFVMIGRGAIGSPQIFLEINEYLKGKQMSPLSRQEYKKILQEYYNLLKITNEFEKFSMIRTKIVQFIRPKYLGKKFKENISKQESLSEIERLIFTENQGYEI